MQIAITGATGFLGRYIVRQLADAGHELRCWYRPNSDRSGFEEISDRITWVPGTLTDTAAAATLVEGCDAVIHAALHRPGAGFRGAEGDIPAFAEANVIGSLRLIEAARAAGAGRFVFISTCAVHEKILEDRPLNEAHPAWPTSHYGAHKAAIEKFIHAYGWGDGYGICALRPCGIYGTAWPVSQSKWFELVQSVTRGETVQVRGGGK